MYKYISLFVILTGIAFAQNDVNSVLDYTLSYRGLTREDVTIPIDFFSAAEKSPTNDSKLLLPIVRDIMINPLRSMTWLDSVSGWGDATIGIQLKNCFRFFSPYISYHRIIYAYAGDINSLCEKLVNNVPSIRKKRDKILKN
jgi:hypothetical protein